VEARARSRPDDEAIRTAAERLTYGQLADRIDRVAAALDELGVATGDRVAFSGQPGSAYLETLGATLSLGAAFVPLNPAHPADVAAWIVGDADPRVVAADSSSSLTEGLDRHERTLVDIGGAFDDGVPFARLEAWERRSRARDVPPAAVALLAYTSGSTGRPKGVMLTHANLTWNALNIGAVADFHAGDGVLVAASFYRMGGLSIVLQTILAGGVVEIPPALDAATLVRAVDEWRPAVVFTGPQQLRAMTDDTHWRDADLSSLRFVFIGGGPVDQTTASRLANRGIPAVGGYGLSEAAPLLLFADGRETLERPGSAGVPPPFVDAAIVAEDGTPVADGTVGELIARGPNVMAGYWRRPDATAAKLRDGWLWTGDLARRDPDGGLRIVGRVEDAIRTRAGTIFAGDVERLVAAQPGVAHVKAVGLERADVAGTETVVGVAVVPAPGERLDATALERLLASAEPPVPDAVVAIVEAIPLSAGGKPVPDAVRRLVSAARGERDSA
jgi:fatty-acyl-CoA synthase